MTHAEIVDYTVAPVFMIDREKRSSWMDDWIKKGSKMHSHFPKNIRRHLTKPKFDYEAKRHNNTTLNYYYVARENLFYEWLKDRDKLGGQHKIPRLSNQRDYLEQLKEMQSKIIL
jgi:hypothetical protein